MLSLLIGTPLDVLMDFMPRRESPRHGEMVPGTLDMLVLQVLLSGPAHGNIVADVIERRSEGALRVEQGSLYPALYRLEKRSWIASFPGTSENNRNAKYYRLTPEGRRQLAIQAQRWDELVMGIGRVMNPVSE